MYRYVVFVAYVFFFPFVVAEAVVFRDFKIMPSKAQHAW